MIKIKPSKKSIPHKRAVRSDSGFEELIEGEQHLKHLYIEGLTAGERGLAPPIQSSTEGAARGSSGWHLESHGSMTAAAGRIDQVSTGYAGPSNGFSVPTAGLIVH